MKKLTLIFAAFCISATHTAYAATTTITTPSTTDAPVVIVTPPSSTPPVVVVTPPSTTVVTPPPKPVVRGKKSKSFSETLSDGWNGLIDTIATPFR